MQAPRTILLTGAAGAIGGALARALAARFPDAHLALSDLSGDALAAAVQACPGRASAWGWDLARVDELPARHAELVARHGDVDLLVNCAGIMQLRSVATTPWRDAARLLDVDLIAPLRLQSLCVPAMCARGGGAVINVSSMAGRVPLRGAAYYGAAKAGLAMASEIARLELAPHGVRVITVYPGPVASALERGARAQLRPSAIARALPVGAPATIARAIVRALDDDRPRVVYPALYALADRALSTASWITRRFSPMPAE